MPGLVVVMSIEIVHNPINPNVKCRYLACSVNLMFFTAEMRLHYTNSLFLTWVSLTAKYTMTTESGVLYTMAFITAER